MATETYLYQGEYAQSLIAKGETLGEARGEARGEAKSVLRVLEYRGISVGDGDRERIMSCLDLDTLEMWLQRALSVDSAEKLFL
ncbi:hypothetical protein ABZ297_43995 [Nonomuraea sp. NPDC005983]|uniref:hypothetical protein n=1 Tax=Nonomuraea sp. NPDC005983 TaxID=3155595 RepID=UPI0033B5ADEB